MNLVTDGDKDAYVAGLTQCVMHSVFETPFSIILLKTSIEGRLMFVFTPSIENTNDTHTHHAL